MTVFSPPSSPKTAVYLIDGVCTDNHSGRSVVRAGDVSVMFGAMTAAFSVALLIPAPPLACVAGLVGLNHLLFHESEAIGGVDFFLDGCPKTILLLN